jgi:hypothetical protein
MKNFYLKRFMSILLVSMLLSGVAYFVLQKTESHPGSQKPLPILDNRGHVPEDIQQHIQSKADLIQVIDPRPYTVFEDPYIFQGEARGSWFFEGDFPVMVTNWDGLIIGTGIATAQSPWMTENFVSFKGTAVFDTPVPTDNPRGYLIFKKNNPSGLPEHDNALEIPIFFY